MEIDDTIAGKPRTGSFSISLWVRPDVIDFQNIIVNASYGNMPENNQLRLIEYSRQLRLTREGYFEHYGWRYPQEINGATALTGRTKVTPGTWYHVALTAEAEGYMRLYVNGEEDVEAIKVKSENAFLGTIYIGAESGNAVDPTLNPDSFQGAVDEVSRYDRVLSSEEIRNQYLSAKGDGTD